MIVAKRKVMDKKLTAFLESAPRNYLKTLLVLLYFHKIDVGLCETLCYIVIISFYHPNIELHFVKQIDVIEKIWGYFWNQRPKINLNNSSFCQKHKHFFLQTSIINDLRFNFKCLANFPNIFFRCMLNIRDHFSVPSEKDK